MQNADDEENKWNNSWLREWVSMMASLDLMTVDDAHSRNSN